MFAAHHAAVRAFLLGQRLVNEVRLAGLEAEHRVTGRPLADLTLAAGLVEREQLLRAVARTLGFEYISEVPATLDGAILAAVPGRIARRHGILPLRTDERGTDVLVADPFDPDTAEELAFVIERPVRLLFADPERIEAQVRRHYGDADRESSRSPAGAGIDPITEPEAEPPAEGDLAVMSGRQPIVAFVTHAIARAIRERASDLHFEPFEAELRIRYRVDGVLREMPPQPRHLALPVTSRLKVLANLNIAERRHAQDGRIQVMFEGRAVDLRVSTMPTQFGESVVLRILDQAAVQLDLTELGMPPDVLQGVREVLGRPHGIFIVTGPTGSGKTTTLYGALRQLNRIERKVLTAEDPVEYELEGIVQVPVNHAAGVGFATALRSFLRHDPDIIMVGEIRDLETARIAIQAALTGHLVLTTLHTNDAAGAITRLVDLGVEPFLLASTVEAVLAQRLVRRRCESCRQTGEVEPSSGGAVTATDGGRGNRSELPGAGCEQCGGSGFRGRQGIFELLRTSSGIRDLICRRAPVREIQRRAIAEGMRPLRQAGRRAVREGHTTSEEVLKHT